MRAPSLETPLTTTLEGAGAGRVGALAIAVLGGAGFAGGELLRLLAGHPRVGRVRAFSRSHAGTGLAAVHPPLWTAAQAVFADAPVEQAVHGADVVMLAMAHGDSQRVMETVLAAQPRLVVDLGADFRLQDRARAEATYGPHACWPLVAGFAYGLADVEAEELSGAACIAAPGCFATAALLALRPLAAAGLLDGPVSCFAVTGSSGAGAVPKSTTHHPLRAHNLFAYALEGHRHEAEISERLDRWAGPGAGCRLLAHAGPFVRGIHATLHARLARPLRDPAAFLAAFWQGRPFMRVLPHPPELAAVVGTNLAHVHAVARDEGREVVVTVAIDNLVKGAAGQAVQAMNLALDLGETAGLGFGGIWPC